MATADGNLRPDDYVTEAEFSAMMQRAFRRSPDATPLFERPSGVLTRAEAADFVYEKLVAAQAIATAPTKDSAPRLATETMPSSGAAPATFSGEPAAITVLPASIEPKPVVRAALMPTLPAPVPSSFQEPDAATRKQLEKQLLNITGIEPILIAARFDAMPADSDVPQHQLFSPGNCARPDFAPPESMPQPLSERTGDRQSASTIRINVMGAVNHPGSVQLPINTSLPAVLEAVGGFREPALPHALDLIRQGLDGTVTRQTIQSHPLPPEFAPLQDNDVVIVKPLAEV